MIVVPTSPAVTSLPVPLPGAASSFAMPVRLRLPRRTNSSIRRSGVPTQEAADHETGAFRDQSGSTLDRDRFHGRYTRGACLLQSLHARILGLAI